MQGFGGKEVVLRAGLSQWRYYPGCSCLGNGWWQEGNTGECHADIVGVVGDWCKHGRGALAVLKSCFGLDNDVHLLFLIGWHIAEYVIGSDCAKAVFLPSSGCVDST